jgi:GTPase SAR1 family protein
LGKNVTNNDDPGVPDPAAAAGLSGDGIRYAGLMPNAEETRRLSQDFLKRLAAFSYKKRAPYAWVLFVGGTGTGKSTLFNAFCGKPLSQTGVERPKTQGPVVYAHHGCAIEKGFPFRSIRLERRSSTDESGGPLGGWPGDLLILEHCREEWSHLVVVDTPDLDSVEARNREITEDLYLLSDVVVFVASQEKYADEIPHRFLSRAIREQTPNFFLLNKVDKCLAEEVLGTLASQGIPLEKDRLWRIPYLPAGIEEGIAGDPDFRSFVVALSREILTGDVTGFREKHLKRRARDLEVRLNRLLTVLEEEEEASRKWLARLEAVYQRASHDLIKRETERFMSESRGHVRAEIRRLFARYDVLAGPRRFIRAVVLAPFRLFGLLEEKAQKDTQGSLLKVRDHVDLTVVETAIERFSRLVLEELSPPDAHSPLFSALREPGVVLDDGEIRQRITQAQDRLAQWLQQTFQKLVQGIPKSKEWGLYSTSVLWGILIVVFEIVVGGGFSVLDAVLDSAIAPFVTKGSVELFAYHEIQQIGRELASRYRDGLLDVVREQRDRYQTCLEALMTPEETLQSLKEMRTALASEAGDGT